MKPIAQRTLATISASTIAAGALLTGGAVPATATPGAHGIQWGPCPQRVDNPRAQCATVEVPMDYANPGGEQISVTALRLPATGQSQGSVFVNPGGPGGDALTTYGSSHSPLQIPEEISRDFDVIAVQPRGLPDSTPLRCLESAGPGYLAQSLFATGAANRQACETMRPGYAQQITTANTARDFDAVRAGLGAERINLLGLSYGTLLASVYATLFPQHTDKVVLDSGYSPSLMWNELMATQKGGYERALHDFFAWVAANDSTHHLGTTPLAAYQSWSRKVTAESGTNPTVVPPAAQLGDVPAGFEWAGQSAADLMTATGQQRVQLEGLASQVTNPGANQSHSPTLMMTRQLVPMPKLWDVLARHIEGTLDEQELKDISGVPDSNTELEQLAKDQLVSVTMQNIMICNEATTPAHPERYPEYLWFNYVTGDIFAAPPATFDSGAFCQGAAPITQVPSLDGSQLATRPLQLQSLGDPQTVFGKFGQMAEQMNSHVVQVDGSGHGQVGMGNPVADQLVAEYLHTGSVEATEIPGIDPSAAR